jgi:hypothetical protein
MHAMSRTFRRRTAARRPAPKSEPGCLPGVALSDLRRLCLPPERGPFGYFRPPLSETALRLSLELSYMPYTLDLAPWMTAGWTDISIQVDNRLEGGVIVGESESAKSEHIRALINAWKLTRARMALKERNPVAQLMGAFRQRERSDTIKAVTMLHPVGDGRYVVAIGFMGTGSRFYDWFSNFRFTTEDGFHKGFYQLTEYFERSAGRIAFPETAAALGRKRLTLADVLAEMRSPHSRFSLWMAGHSQGAAVMQVFCHKLITGWGVLARNMVGYGFASPTTVAGERGRAPGVYPLFHLLNSDDLVPRVGALMHLGLGLYYQTDEPLRRAAYGWDDTPAGRELLACAETLTAHVTDTPSMLTSLAALGEVIIEEKTEESLNALMEKRWSIAPLDKAFSYAEGKATGSLMRVVRYTKVAYHSLMGRRMEEDTVAAIKEEMRPVVRSMPMRRLMEALRDRMHPPHMLCRSDSRTGAYGYIVAQGRARLRPFVWEADGGKTPRLRFAAGYAAFGGHAAAPLARRPSRPSPRSRGIGALRARRGVGGACTARRRGL